MKVEHYKSIYFLKAGTHQMIMWLTLTSWEIAVIHMMDVYIDVICKSSAFIIDHIFIHQDMGVLDSTYVKECHVDHNISSPIHFP